jgi:hypothetical protein
MLRRDEPLRRSLGVGLSDWRPGQHYSKDDLLCLDTNVTEDMRRWKISSRRNPVASGVFRASAAGWAGDVTDGVEIGN